jgi:hypothetical protein
MMPLLLWLHSLFAVFAPDQIQRCTRANDASPPGTAFSSWILQHAHSYEVLASKLVFCSKGHLMKKLNDGFLFSFGQSRLNAGTWLLLPQFRLSGRAIESVEKTERFIHHLSPLGVCHAGGFNGKRRETPSTNDHVYGALSQLSAILPKWGQNCSWLEGKVPSFLD